jgi:hypothetical protein
MHAIAATQIYDVASINGEQLLTLLVVFGLGALFGRIILLPQKRHALEPQRIHALPPARSLRKESPEDDLKRIPGIGPQVEEALRAGGIRSFAELARSSRERLEVILHEAGRSSAGVRSWPVMAALLASQKDPNS